jgi:sugar lactone lactonase YvrE
MPEAIAPVTDTSMKLGECPLWHPEEKSLYWIDIPGMAVHRLTPATGSRQTWPLPSEPGCIARCDESQLLIAMRSGLAMLNTVTGDFQKFAEAPYDTSKMRFNDGRCDSSGRLWVGTLYEPRDQPAAPLFCVERGTIRDSGKRATVSNGVAFSPDNLTLYHSDTTSHRIMAYDFDLANGAVGEARLFRQFSMDKTNAYGGRPDGAAVDSEGAYWCAMFEGGRILRCSPEGEILREIALPVRCPTMIAFGGNDLRTLYITTARHNRPAEELVKYPLSGHLLSLQVDVAGQIEPAYRL